MFLGDVELELRYSRDGYNSDASARELGGCRVNRDAAVVTLQKAGACFTDRMGVV